MINRLKNFNRQSFSLLFFSLFYSCLLIGEQNMALSEQMTLKIVEIGDPVLRQQARLLSKEEILSRPIQELIEKMKNTMREAPGVGLAAPQIGLPIQLAVIEDPFEYQCHLTSDQLTERERSVVPFHVIINPKLIIEEEELAEFFEGCLSIPSLIGVVPRAKSVRVECLNEKAEPITIRARGWYARILQHEIDHLNGFLYLDHVHTRTLTTSENFNEFWKNKSITEATSNNP